MFNKKENSKTAVIRGQMMGVYEFYDCKDLK